MNDLRSTDRRKVTVSLIGKNYFIGHNSLQGGSNCRRPSVSGLEDVEVEIIIRKDRASHRGDTHYFLTDIKQIDALRNYSVDQAVAASRTISKRGSLETLRSVEDFFHSSP